jgi:hypothetical protein
MHWWNGDGLGDVSSMQPKKIPRPIFTVCAGMYPFQQIGVSFERRADAATLLELLVVRSSGESRWSRVLCAQGGRADAVFHLFQLESRVGCNTLRAQALFTCFSFRSPPPLPTHLIFRRLQRAKSANCAFSAHCPIPSIASRCDCWITCA